MVNNLLSRFKDLDGAGWPRNVAHSPKQSNIEWLGHEKTSNYSSRLKKINENMHVFKKDYNNRGYEGGENLVTIIQFNQCPHFIHNSTTLSAYKWP